MICGGCAMGFLLLFWEADESDDQQEIKEKSKKM